MEIADAQKFLQENHRACIAVRQKDGWPQMTLVTPGIDPEGRVIITSRGTTYKLKHLRRDAQVISIVRRFQMVQIRSDGKNPGRIDVKLAVITHLDFLQIQRVFDSRPLIELAQVIRQIWIILDAAQITLEVAVVDQVKAQERRESSPVGF